MTKEITIDPSGKKEVTQEKLQEKLMLFQLMERQLEVLKQQGAMIEQRFIEIETTKAALGEIEELKPDNEALIPLGSGLYVRANITGKGIMTEIGSSVMKEKSIKDAMGFIDERKSEIEKVAKNVEKDMVDITEKLQEMGPELQKMASQLQKK